MRPKIVLSVLGSTRTQYQQRLRRALRLHQPLHLDVMDGHFVTTRSISPRVLKTFHVPVAHELHLMVTKPQEWIDVVDHLQTRTVILPVELGPAVKVMIALFRSHGVAVALSINPNTPVSRLRPWLKTVRRVHIMTVRPGRYGAPFVPSMIQRVVQLRRLSPRTVISCDGAVGQKTLPALYQAGTSIFVVGSDVLLSAKPQAELDRLKKLLSAPVF